MRHLYLLSLFFCFFNVSAQLIIWSSHTGSSYFYAKDRVLFIEDDIQLEKKPPKVVEAGISLKEGQLIQREKAANKNSGNKFTLIFKEIAHFWDHSNDVTYSYLEDYEVGYGAYCPGADIYAPAVFKIIDQSGNAVEGTGEIGKLYSRRFSPQEQAFILMGNENGEGIFKNSQRIFMKGIAQTSQLRTRENPISKINLNISFNELYTRQLILVFREDATTAVDHAVDAKSFEGLASDAAWLIDDEAYVRIVLPFVKEQKLPISILLENKGTIKISMGKAKNLPAENIFLFDAQENFYQDLKSLNFITELPAGNYHDRFYLVFTEEIKEPEIANPLDEDFPKEDMLVSYDEKSHQVEILAKDFLDYIELYDLTGELILTKRIYDNQQYYYFYTGKLKEAVYIVKIKTRGNIYYSTKLNLKK